MFSPNALHLVRPLCHILQAIVAYQSKSLPTTGLV